MIFFIACENVSVPDNKARSWLFHADSMGLTTPSQSFSMALVRSSCSLSTSVVCFCSSSLSSASTFARSTGSCAHNAFFFSSRAFSWS